MLCKREARSEEAEAPRRDRRAPSTQLKQKPTHTAAAAALRPQTSNADPQACLSGSVGFLTLDDRGKLAIVLLYSTT